MPCAKGCCATNREHWLSLNISADALPNKGKAVTSISQTEKRWDRDMSAYKRLRDHGLQPRGIDGSAKVETMASEQFEVNTSHILTKQQQKQAKEGIAMAKELSA